MRSDSTNIVELLPRPDVASLGEITINIRSMQSRTVECLIEIGRQLTIAKEQVNRGGFIDWIRQEFQWSVSTAERFIRVYERFGSNSSRVTNLEPGVLYLLAAKSTSEQVREDILSRVEQGEKLAVKQMREMVAAAQPKRDGLRPDAVRRCLPAVPEGTTVSVSQDLARLIDAWENASGAARREFLSLISHNAEQPILPTQAVESRDTPNEAEPEFAPNPSASSVTDAVSTPKPEAVDASACYLKCRDAGSCQFPQQCPPLVRFAKRAAS